MSAQPAPAVPEGRMACETPPPAATEAASEAAATADEVASIATSGGVPANADLPALDRLADWLRALATRRAAWLSHLRLDGEVGAMQLALADADAPAAERAWRETDTQGRELTQRAEGLALAVMAEQDSRLARLVTLFAPDHTQRCLLYLALAPAIEPGLRDVYAALDPSGRGEATPWLAARLFDLGRHLAVDPGRPLLRWRVLIAEYDAAGRVQAFALDPHVFRWLLGDDALDPMLVDSAAWVMPEAPFAAWPVSAAAAAWGRTLAGDAPPSRLRVWGRAGSGRATFAACVAAELGLPLFRIEPRGAAGVELAELHARAMRDSLLLPAVPAWVGETPATLSDERPPLPLQARLLQPGEAAPRARAFDDYDVPLDGPQAGERDALWLRHHPAAASWPAAARQSLAARERATPAELIAAARRAPADLASAHAHLAGEMRGALDEFAERIDAGAGWDDLILSTQAIEALREFAFEIGDREALLGARDAQRLFAQERGRVLLLHGPSGVGKTLAAQVLAGDLGRDLYRVNLSHIVSKYVGETSQRLEALLQRSRDSDAILFFDEADTLFARRTDSIRDAHDRYANADTNHLLAALERFAGIAVLATNKRAHLDPAFTRRIRHAVELARPNAELRRRLWAYYAKALLGSDVAERMATLFDELSERFELSGAQVKHAALSAALRARRAARDVAAEDVLAGIDRELAKDGSGLSARHRDQLLGSHAHGR